MKKLFLSLTATLAGMVDGTVTDADLRTGLFMFGNPRDHALKTNMAPNDGDKSWTGVSRAVHETLIGHLQVAEQEKRVGWIRPTPARHAGYPLARRDDFVILNELLTKNGMRHLNQEGRFTFQGVSEALTTKGMQLQAVF